MQLRRLLLVIGIGAVALVAFAVSGAGAGLEDATLDGMDSDEASAATGENASAQLGESIVRVEQDEETTVRIHLADTAKGTIVVGGTDALNITNTVTDSNGDGVVALEFDAGGVGPQATHFHPANDGDDYGTLWAGPDGAIPVGEYDIDVYVGHGVGGEPSDVGTLVISEPAPPPEASFDSTPVTLDTQANQTVSGTTELDEGRNVTIRLRSAGDSPFLMSNQVSVGESGDFSAAFDLSDVSAPANATAVVSVDGETMAQAQVDVVEESGSTSSGGQPGFGVGVGMGATLLAAYLARRRSRR